MSFPGPGRKRVPNLERLSAEDEALSQVAREAEARLAAKRAARAEAREIRMKELERQQKEEDSERCSRLPRRHASVSDDEERMSAGSRGSLRPSDHGGLLGSSSRASSRASSARASPVVEERTDFLDRGTRTMSALSAATLASLGGASRRGSCDTTFSLETEVSIREMKNSLAEAEEKYRRAMVSNALLHNEKAALMYQEEVLREELADTEELLWEARRHRDDVNKVTYPAGATRVPVRYHRLCRLQERERERREHGLLRVQFRDLKEALRQTEDLLMEASDLRLKTSGYCQEISDLQEALTWKEKQVGALERQRETSDIVRMERDRLRDDIVRLRDVLKRHGLHPPDITSNGESDRANDDVDDVTAESSFRLAEQAPQGMLELRLKTLFEERESLRDQVRLLQSQLHQRNGTDRVQSADGPEDGVGAHLLELQRDASRQMSELKFKLVKSEQEVTALEQNVIRLEGQVSRYKLASENAEKIEDELKVEKRKLQRELRSALDRVGELEASNGHLSKRLEKMKASRSALLAQQ